ncbi:MAG: (2Fe-2S)-binding protein [Gammaproteobacteria bacterium]
MSQRIIRGVERPAPVDLSVNGVRVTAYEGESLVTALIASGTLTMSRDETGRPRTPFCNMGVCFDCLVLVEDNEAPDTPPVTVRACMTAIRTGLRITVPVK